MAPVVVLKAVLAAEVVGAVSGLPTQAAEVLVPIVDWYLGIVGAPADIADTVVVEDIADTVAGIVLGQLGIHIQIVRDIHQELVGIEDSGGIEGVVPMVVEGVNDYFAAVGAVRDVEADGLFAVAVRPLVLPFQRDA